jgi:hypothetical protein
LKASPNAYELESFLPNHWLATNHHHRWTIADRRADEREAKSAN